MSWHAYILKCSDGCFYVGHAENVEARLAMHNSGKGAVYTAQRRPATLVT